MSLEVGAIMEEEVVEKDTKEVALADAEELVGPNEVVARALDGTRLYLYNHQVRLRQRQGTRRCGYRNLALFLFFYLQAVTRVHGALGGRSHGVSA